jgi:integrase
MAKEREYVLSDKNWDAIDNYISDITGEIDNENTLRDHKEFNVMLLGTIKKDYDKIKPEDVYKAYSKFKPTSIEVMKSKNRRFFRFVNRNDLADKIKLKPKVLRKSIRGDEAVLTPDEINNLIECNKDHQDRAIVETYIITGGRSIELRHLRLCDIEIGDPIIWIKLPPFKGAENFRRVPVVAIKDNPICRYPKYLIDWINNHPFKGEEKHSLFYSRARNKRGNQYSKSGIYKVIKRAYELSGIERNISPHIIRHTCATYDGKFISEQLMCTKYNWKIGSPQLRRYCHSTENHLAEEYIRRAGLTKNDVGKGQECLRCHTTNHSNAEFCKNCKYPLTKEGIDELVQKERKEKEELVKQMGILQDDFKTLNKEVAELKGEISKSLNVIITETLKKLGINPEDVAEHEGTVEFKKDGIEVKFDKIRKKK